MILTIAAQKGGVSKTTTAAAICQALAYKKKNTLLIDGDAQGSASLIYGTNEDGSGGTYSLIMGNVPAADLIQTTPAGNIIPASPLLDRLDVELNNKPGRDSFLKAGIDPIKEKFDCIVIDTAPGLGTCLVQALTAADMVIIPLLCDPQALQGLHQVTETIEEVKKYCNPALKIGAVVLTQYQARATLTRQYEDLIKEQCREMGLPFAETRIRRAIALQEAQASRESLYEYNANCNPAADYMALCKEIGLLK
jgi:chromosome partitioning protein